MATYPNQNESARAVQPAAPMDEEGWRNYVRNRLGMPAGTPERTDTAETMERRGPR